MYVVLDFCGGELTVSVENGGLRGKYMESRKGRQFRAFLGIPYAKAPIGELRFEPPQPAENWNGVRNATEAGEICFQTNLQGTKYVGSENCLFLNVYAPKDATNLPVMMFVHGGAHFSGSGSPRYFGPEILLDKDVVLVTVDFRLGALGFLATGDEVVPGNTGLKDLIFALKWIQRNIRSFGGNPGSVTIFGQSTGGGSVYLLTLSPLAKGLFHAAIVHSGSGICDWSLQTRKESSQLSTRLGRILECPTNSSREMVECMRKLPVENFVKAKSELLQWHVDPQVIFKPAREPPGNGALLPDTPVNLMASGRTSDVPIILGNAAQDGSMKVVPLYLNPERLVELDEKFEDLAFLTLRFTYEDFKRHMPKIRRFYFRNQKIAKLHKNKLINMYTDGMFLQCTDQAIRMHRKYLKAPIYTFLFGYQGEYSYSNYQGAKDRSFGVSHVDDMQYLFKLTVYQMSGPLNVEDGKMADFFTERWVNFANDKVPSGSSCNGTKWKPAKSRAHEYLHIRGPENMVMSKRMAKQRLRFWRRLNLMADPEM